jgi:hypothetical protein
MLSVSICTEYELKQILSILLYYFVIRLLDVALLHRQVDSIEDLEKLNSMFNNKHRIDRNRIRLTVLYCNAFAIYCAS